MHSTRSKLVYYKNKLNYRNIRAIQRGGVGESWACTRCTFLNTYPNKCEMCGMPATKPTPKLAPKPTQTPAITPTPATKPTPSPATKPTPSPAKTWRCPLCTFINSHIDEICTVCSAHKSSSPSTNPSTLPTQKPTKPLITPAPTKEHVTPIPKAPSPLTPSANWACPLCTFLNPQSATVCAACETAKHSTSASPTKTSGSQPVVIHAKSVQWVCPQCTFHCEDSDRECTKCEMHKHEKDKLINPDERKAFNPTYIEAYGAEYVVRVEKVLHYINTSHAPANGYCLFSSILLGISKINKTDRPQKIPIFESVLDLFQAVKTYIKIRKKIVEDMLVYYTQQSDLYVSLVNSFKDVDGSKYVYDFDGSAALPGIIGSMLDIRIDVINVSPILNCTIYKNVQGPTKWELCGLLSPQYPYIKGQKADMQLINTQCVDNAGNGGWHYDLIVEDIIREK